MNLGERGLFIHFSSVKSHIKRKRKKGEKLIGRKSLVDNTQKHTKRRNFRHVFLLFVKSTNEQKVCTEKVSQGG